MLGRLCSLEIHSGDVIGVTRKELVPVDYPTVYGALTRALLVLGLQIQEWRLTVGCSLQPEVVH